ncbi:MAG TPA: DNA-binding response regulator [Syntrophomonas sp.]|jgi:two-component system LytT family response regulator|nr:DNA-binding response regulator [Syntrophomonas sp.]HCF71031.1 DNA-binding response regulator [Syntrophomonas sp.]
MAKILLLEDEDYTRKFLKKLIEQSELVEWVFDAASGREALDLFALHKPDIAIMDIELGADQELNGIEVARQIYSLAPQTYFVFLTGYSRYAIDSFCVHPYDYILKPVKQNRVREVIDILAAKVQMRLNDEKIVIKLKKETLLLQPGDIIFVEKRERNIILHTKFGVYELNHTLGEMSSILGNRFIRVHKSFIVNPDKIASIQEVSERSYEITFDDYAATAQMSRYRFNELYAYLTMRKKKKTEN